MNSNTRQQVLWGRDGGGRGGSTGELLTVLLSSQQDTLTPLHSHFIKSQLSISSGRNIVWSDQTRQARCEVTCFDVHYGNLGQIHSVQLGNLNNKLERWEHIENISNTTRHRGWSPPCQHGGEKNGKYFDKFDQSHYCSTIKIIDDAARIEFIKNSVLLPLSS